MTTRHEVVKWRLTEAIEKLEAAQKHASESLKSSGEAVRASAPAIETAVLGTAELLLALSDARASAKKISEAVAAWRAKQVPAKHAS